MLCIAGWQPRICENFVLNFPSYPSALSCITWSWACCYSFDDEYHSKWSTEEGLGPKHLLNNWLFWHYVLGTITFELFPLYSAATDPIGILQWWNTFQNFSSSPLIFVLFITLNIHVQHVNKLRKVSLQCVANSWKYGKVRQGGASTYPWYTFYSNETFAHFKVAL